MGVLKKQFVLSDDNYNKFRENTEKNVETMNKFMDESKRKFEIINCRLKIIEDRLDITTVILS